jgi:hypothetical protein
LNLKPDELLSNFASKSNLRRYTTELSQMTKKQSVIAAATDHIKATPDECGVHVSGRGLYSSTSQLNLSRFWSLKH